MSTARTSSNGKSFHNIPGVQIVREQVLPRPFSGVVLWDLDRTLKRGGGAQQKRYYEGLRPMSDAAGLDWDLVLLTHNLEERVRQRRAGISNIGGLEGLFPMVAKAMGTSYRGDPEELLRQSLLYQRWVVEVEGCTPIPGIRTVINQARDLWPDLAHIVVTLCPAPWMTEIRLIRGGNVLALMDGHVGIGHDLPPLGTDHPFQKCVESAHSWLEGLGELTREESAHLLLRVGMPAERAKPQPDTIYALAHWAGVSLDRVLMIDDNPLTGGGMSYSAGVDFAHALYDYPEGMEPRDDWPPIPYTLRSVEDIMPLLARKFGQT